VDYYCNPQCIGCGWIVNSPHPLAYYLIVILNQLNIKKIKLTNIILEKNKKNYVGKNTVAIHSNLRGKLQCFPHIL
jgi:hypothetical protein